MATILAGTIIAGVDAESLVGTGLLLVGALAGYFVPWLLVDGPSGPLLLVTAVLGSVLTLAVRRYTRF